MGVPLMAEHKLADGAVPYVSTFEFHRDRERARHLESPAHRPRLEAAAGLVLVAARLVTASGYGGPLATVSDLGCGDGGLLSLIKADTIAWGYDFAPNNAAGWPERGVDAELLDMFGEDRERVKLGDITVMTEVLEHLADPHGAVRWIAGGSKFLVASSPWTEGPGVHDECHAWAWDQVGYQVLLEQGGWRLLRHETVGQFQIALGMQP